MYFRSICVKFFLCSVFKTHSYHVLKYVALKMLRVFIGEMLEFIKLFYSDLYCIRCVACQLLVHRERMDSFLALITDDDVFDSLSESMSPSEKVQRVYRNEGMKTAIDGRYSGKPRFV